jgi:hypothetical protein
MTLMTLTHRISAYLPPLSRFPALAVATTSLACTLALPQAAWS